MNELRCLRHAAVMVGMLAGMASPLAMAQFDISIPPEVIDYAGAAEGAMEASTPVAPVAGKRAPTAALDYHASADVSRKVQRNVLTSIADPAARESLQQAMQNNNILKQFDQLLHQYGYDIGNVADVMTAYYVITWEVVNDQDASRYKSGIQAFHDRLVASLSASPELTGMSDADKQTTAETLSYMAALAAAARNQLKQRGDTAGLGRVQQQVHAATLRMGVDLKALRLTANGFEPA